MMITQPYNVYIERTDKAENKARFYAMSIEPTLFGDASLLRRWGRIASTGRQKIHCFENESQAVELFLAIVRQKRARGYKPRLAERIKL
ncbi:MULTISPECIES: WGR domain-containing protein [Rhizobium]|uniref:WGR domain-containing protein n=2 Tax=Rhizobium TaxID=379 RepID=A0ABY8IRP7_9HYPH|nr:MULTISPECIES: WGR domain-containing protein [Rhizobium]TQX84306.1 WGR domain-containing protein [Rhizobium sp. rho-13.1]TQY07865.1 WGR domain-containing protein [Rhizobium sp. rho-1.1]WFS26211.1 WGR domain-containing protein [Rhizobium rhododendri]